MNITDNDGGISTFLFPSPVVVQPNVTAISSLIDQLSSTPVDPSVITSIFTGNTQNTMQSILAIASALNGLSLADRAAMATDGISTEIIFFY